MIQAPTLWANVLRLATDELLSQTHADKAWELLSRCCEPYRLRGEAVESAVIALGVAEEAGLFAARPDRRVRADYEELRAAALKLLTDHAQLTPKQRDIPSRLLGSGPYPGHDTRPGVGLRADGLPDIDWVPIPDDGEFIYQEDEHRTEPRFWIAHYPVTYAQYRAFLEAEDGYDLDRRWLEPEPLAVPDGHRAKADRQQFKYWNHPAERVSWYDAVAFCRWLTAKVKAQVEAKVEGWEKWLPPELARDQDWKITLPTEWQWEKAARGHDGREFPWGKRYISGCANIDERYGGGRHALPAEDQRGGHVPSRKTGALALRRS